MKKLAKVFLVLTIVLALLASPILLAAGFIAVTYTSNITDVVVSPDGQYKAVILSKGDFGGVSVARSSRWISPYNFGNVYRTRSESRRPIYVEWFDESTLFIYASEGEISMKKTEIGNITIRYFSMRTYEERDIYRPEIQR